MYIYVNKVYINSKHSLLYATLNLSGFIFQIINEMQLFHNWNICSYHCQHCNVDNELFILFTGERKLSLLTISHHTGVETLVVQVHVVNGVSVRVTMASTLRGNGRIITFIFNNKYLLEGFETIKN